MSGKPIRQLNYAGIFVTLIFTVLAGAGLMLLFGRLTGVLTNFIINTLEINEYYADKIIGLFFLVCSSILFLIAMIVDGEQKRLQTALKKYFSKMVVKNYYTQSKLSLAGAKLALEQDPGGTSSRAAASVRPKASVIEEAYKRGEVNGIFKEFFPDGTLKREARYVDGKLNGLFHAFYDSGQIEQEAVYEDGQIEGMYRSYYKDGTLHQEKKYAKGRLNGVYKAFDESGVPFFEISYKDDVQDGPDKTFDQKGVIQYFDTYKNGIMINRKTFDEYGILKFDQYFEENIAVVDKMEGEENVKQREVKEKEKRRQVKKE